MKHMQGDCYPVGGLKDPDPNELQQIRVVFWKVLLDKVAQLRCELDPRWAWRGVWDYTQVQLLMGFGGELDPNSGQSVTMDKICTETMNGPCLHNPLWAA